MSELSHLVVFVCSILSLIMALLSLRNALRAHDYARRARDQQRSSLRFALRRSELYRELGRGRKRA